jgi:uncharacterized repeat protein (TIGR01451 family)
MKIKTIVALFLFILLAAVRAGAWTLFDDFESRNWYDPNWADWFRAGTATYGTYQGRDCVKLTGPTDKGAQSIITNFFPGENWSNVDMIKLDIYVQTSVNTMTAKLEPYSPANTSCIDPTTALPMSTINSWVTYTWDYSIPAAAPVAKLQLIFDILGSNQATFYIDNLRLVLQDGTTHYWDDFNDRGKQWAVSGSTAMWSNLPEYVSHNASTATVNGGAGTLWWNYSGPDFAQLLPSGVNADYRSYNIIRADVRCSTTTIPVKMYFWYGSWGEETEARYVSQKDTWQTLYWDLPAGTTNNNVTGLNPRVCPSALIPNGTFYIDNIYVGNTRLSVSKSTSTASARPGDEVTYTITYKNSGTDEITSLQLIDVMPFNGYISASATIGSADTVEYYVGSSWTATYSAAATKIRWRDNVVSGGGGDNMVSYKVKLR